MHDEFLLCWQQELADGPEPVTSSSRRKGKCTICGIEGHKANNKLFHPEDNPNAKVGPARASKKNAIHQPPQNVGELDDENHNNMLGNDSEEEGNVSDSEDEQYFGEDMLNWMDDEKAHDEVQKDVNLLFGQSIPLFSGPPEDIFAADILDWQPDNNLMQAFNKFFTNDMLETMGNATNHFGEMYVKKWKEMIRSELAAFLGILIYMGLIKYGGDRYRL